ncbi:hypothetical protein V1478_009335 [Vespula squamosa]|uniref:Uncharacterized protein n=1 Tax=Vespula squamosa TaxID=30214 RepID=A0ABD2APD1_VESSQ
MVNDMKYRDTSSKCCTDDGKVRDSSISIDSNISIHYKMAVFRDNSITCITFHQYTPPPFISTNLTIHNITLRYHHRRRRRHRHYHYHHHNHYHHRNNRRCRRRHHHFRFRHYRQS